MAGKFLLDQLRHPEQRSLLQALREAHDRDPRMHERPRRPQRVAEGVRRNADDEQLRLPDGLRQIVRGVEPGGQRVLAEVLRIPPVEADLVGDGRVSRPDDRRMPTRHE